MTDIPKSARQRMAESVTRHAQISRSNDYKLLACGVDTLDIGFYVYWGSGWNLLKHKYDVLKANAPTEGTLIFLSLLRLYLILPGGKAPNYRYHLQFPDYHAFLAISQKVKSTSPNVYVSVSSETLWSKDIEDIVSFIGQDLEALGAQVMSHKVSRIDICADYWLMEALSLDFLREHRVGRSNDSYQYMNGEELEIFYAGGQLSPLKVRIYNKEKEIKDKESEQRWLEIWGRNSAENVWRVEFQARRLLLKQFHIDTVTDLKTKLFALWDYFTKEWFSLRLPDNENPTRRSIHPWWSDVEKCVFCFGPFSREERDYQKSNQGNVKWYLDRIARLILGYAAASGITNFEPTVLNLVRDLLKVFPHKDFKKEVITKAIKMGIQLKDEDNGEYSKRRSRVIESAVKHQIQK